MCRLTSFDTIDWTERETVRTKPRTMVKRLLRKHGYFSDKQEKATQTVIHQAETLYKDWAAFTQQAIGYAFQLRDSKIILIDGQKLTQLID